MGLKTKPLIEMATKGINTNEGVIHIVNKFNYQKRSQRFRCIMVYQDIDSKFCFIRPLLYKIDLEIVMELFRIFTSYGPPNVVHVNSCTHEMVTEIENYMRVLYPKFNIKFEKAQTDEAEILMLVVQKLYKWMELTRKEQWEIGCCAVQRELNTEIGPDELSAHERFFKNLNKKPGDEIYEESSDDSATNELFEENAVAIVQDEPNHTEMIESENPATKSNVRIKEEIRDDTDFVITSNDDGILFQRLGEKKKN